MRRIKLTFWALVSLAIAATGGLSTALSAPPGALTGAAVALAGTVMLLSAGLALRILLVTSRRTG